MSKTRERTASAGPQQHRVADPVAPPRVSARRRRPGVIALSLSLVAAGGAGTAVLLVQAGHRTQAVTVVRDVQVGQVLTEHDLGTVSVALEPGVKAVRAGDLGSVVGRRAAVELKPGSLLAPSQVTRQTLVKTGEEVVPVGLKVDQVPATPLVPGQRIVLVHVPAAQDSGTGKVSEPSPASVGGRVVKASDAAPGSGVVVVDVATAASDGPTVAAWVASGTLRLVLAAPGGN